MQRDVRFGSKSLRWLVAGMILAMAGLATAGKKPTSHKTTGGKTPVTFEFREPPLNVDGDRIDGDGGGVYVDGVDRVKAYIQSGAHLGDPFLDLANTKGVRLLWLEFNALDCISVPATDCQPPFAREGVFSTTALATLAADLPGMPLDVPTPARLRLSFWSPPAPQGQGWFLRLDPFDTETSCRSSFATVTRTAPDTWVLEASSSDEACLLTQPGNAQAKVPRGKYHMPFKVTIRLK